jgi:hypothetical protein
MYKMRKIVLASAIGLALASCNNSTPARQEGKAADTAQLETKTDTASAMYFGEKINEEGAISLADLKGQMGDKKEMKVKLVAPVEAVCQKKGCWMDLKNTDGEAVRVTFKDYGFFMPMDCAGKTAVVDGVAKIEETSVDMLKEYAKDAGKSKEEIAAIKEPKKELVFEANGVILK